MMPSLPESETRMLNGHPDKPRITEDSSIQREVSIFVEKKTVQKI
jgi:hypothetical protein